MRYSASAELSLEHASVGQDVLTMTEVLSGEFEHLKHPCMAHWLPGINLLNICSVCALCDRG